MLSGRRSNGHEFDLDLGDIDASDDVGERLISSEDHAVAAAPVAGERHVAASGPQRLQTRSMHQLANGGGDVDIVNGAQMTNECDDDLCETCRWQQIHEQMRNDQFIKQKELDRREHEALQQQYAKEQRDVIKAQKVGHFSKSMRGFDTILGPQRQAEADAQRNKRCQLAHDGREEEAGICERESRLVDVQSTRHGRSEAAKTERAQRSAVEADRNEGARKIAC